MSRCFMSLEEKRVSSASTISAVFRTSIALMVISSRFPMGVGTKINLPRLSILSAINIKFRMRHQYYDSETSGNGILESAFNQVNKFQAGFVLLPFKISTQVINGIFNVFH